MVPKIPIEIQKMTTQIEGEPLPCYLVNAGINQYKGEFLKYKKIMKAKQK